MDLIGLLQDQKNGSRKQRMSDFICVKYPGSCSVNEAFCSKRYKKAIDDPDNGGLEFCRNCERGKTCWESLKIESASLPNLITKGFPEKKKNKVKEIKKEKFCQCGKPEGHKGWCKYEALEEKPETGIHVTEKSEVSEKIGQLNKEPIKVSLRNTTNLYRVLLNRLDNMPELDYESFDEEKWLERWSKLFKYLVDEIKELEKGRQRLKVSFEVELFDEGMYSGLFNLEDGTQIYLPPEDSEEKAIKKAEEFADRFNLDYEIINIIENEKVEGEK